MRVAAAGRRTEGNERRKKEAWHSEGKPLF